MHKSDVALLLGYAAVLDGRIQVDAPKVTAWHMTLSVHMPYEFAREAVTQHYATMKESVTPYALNVAYRLMLERKTQVQATASTMLELSQAKEVAVPPERVSDYVKQIKETIRANKQRNDDENS